MAFAIRAVVLIFLLVTVFAWSAPVPDSQEEWRRLVTGLVRMGLPSTFLRLLPVEFVKLHFGELKNAAAEYHPDGHRMIFHTNLSVEGQGRRFRPVAEIASQDLATIYHELFHAYFDYVDFAASTPKMDPRGARLHAEAKRLLTCRYTMVEVVVGPPQKGRQHKSRVEPRRLTESEGWDALNETWGVFVGWAIWNRLETTDRLGRRWDWDAIEGFLDRLDEAYQNGDISGYYEPVDVDARKVMPRWYLAPSHAISAPEIALLLDVILDEPPGMVELVKNWIGAPEDRPRAPGLNAC